MSAFFGAVGLIELIVGGIVLRSFLAESAPEGSGGN
jgi:hypothetical protein